MKKTLTAVIYGPPKVGKSWLLDTIPAPRLIVDAEGSTEDTPSKKVVWNPQKGRPPENDGTWETCVVHVTDYETLDRVYQWLSAGEHDFVSAGFDQLTEIQDRIITHFNGTSALREADWGTLLRHMKDWTRKHRDLRYHPTKPLDAVVFNCAARTKDDIISPYLAGQYADWLPYAVDLIGYYIAAPDEDEGGIARRMLIEPRANIIAGCRKDRLVQEYGGVIDSPNFASILEVLNNEQ